MKRRSFVPYHRITLLLFFSVVLEALSQTFLFSFFDKKVISLLYLFSGLLVAFLPMLRVEVPEKKPEKSYAYLTWTGFASLVVASVLLARPVFVNWSLDHHVADMLPVIRTMGERWLAGASVYAVIPEIWDGIQPQYFPAMWMPFVPALALGIDLRWTNLLFLLLGVALALQLFSRGVRRDLRSHWVFVPALVLFGYILLKYPGLIAITEEPVVVGFYLLLAFSLWQKRPVLIGVSLALCVLSRYALLFWAPMFLFYLFLEEGRRTVLRVLMSGAVAGVSLMVISQAMLNLDILVGAQSVYLDDLLDPTKEWGHLQTIGRNLGIAKFIPFEHILGLHRFFLYGSLALPFLCLLAFYRWRERLNVEFFALCSLKLSLVFFYNTLPRPYSYLFYTSTFFSIAILYAYLTWERAHSAGR